jgi:DNA topoisomerase-1
MARLIHVSADSAGYQRKGRGKGFEYFDASGKKISDRNELDRITALRIPPAWKNVWVCADPDGHLQATGIDARGRKQYLYHSEWNRRSQLNKFDKMAGFAKALPDIRKRIDLDLRKKGWPREKVVALMIQILDQHSLRIGNRAYELENGTFGLTTLKLKHLKVEDDGIAFQFKAKGGIYRRTRIRGKKLTRLILECSELPGQEVFQFLDAEGNPHPVFSNDVNSYLQEIAGNEYTAKDFRTWGGTVWAVELFGEVVKESEITPSKNLVTSLVREVAEKLGNTVAVCRQYYIHPSILAAAELHRVRFDKFIENATAAYSDLIPHLSPYEAVALYLIEGGDPELKVM